MGRQVEAGENKKYATQSEEQKLDHWDGANVQSSTEGWKKWWHRSNEGMKKGRIRCKN